MPDPYEVPLLIERPVIVDIAMLEGFGEAAQAVTICPGAPGAIKELP